MILSLVVAVILKEDDLRINPSLPFASDKHHINGFIGISIPQEQTSSSKQARLRIEIHIALAAANTLDFDWISFSSSSAISKSLAMACPRLWIQFGHRSWGETLVVEARAPADRLPCSSSAAKPKFIGAEPGC